MYVQLFVVLTMNLLGIKNEQTGYTFKIRFE